jgi:hypothetical protein
MSIKEIVEMGGIVSFPYKEKPEDYVEEAKIYQLTPMFGLKPKIIVVVGTEEIYGRKEFDIDQLDEAIELYTRLVFRKENLKYKFKEAATILYNQGHTQLDMDRDEDKELVLNKRLELINAN